MFIINRTNTKLKLGFLRLSGLKVVKVQVPAEYHVTALYSKESSTLVWSTRCHRWPIAQNVQWHSCF